MASTRAPDAADLASLLTEAVGTIAAVAVMAGKEDRIAAYTAPYVAAINAFDNARPRRLPQAERVDLSTVPSSMEVTAESWKRT